jgi:DNA-directed RNA polymerase specialized sigma24 family protein
MAGNESDEGLMALVAQGDQRAFRILMGRHMGLAIRVAQRIVGDAAEADDIGQDAFLRVWSRASSFHHLALSRRPEPVARPGPQAEARPDRRSE